jgi:hypothetical protein
LKALLQPNLLEPDPIALIPTKLVAGVTMGFPTGDEHERRVVFFLAALKPCTRAVHERVIVVRAP